MKYEFSMQAFVRKASSLLDTPFYEGFLWGAGKGQKKKHNKWILKKLKENAKFLWLKLFHFKVIFNLNDSIILLLLPIRNLVF